MENSERDGYSTVPDLPPEKSVGKSVETMVRTGQGTIGTIASFHNGKGVCQGFTLSPCLLKLYAQ